MLQEALKQKRFEKKRKQCLIDTLLDAKETGMSYKELSEVLREPASSLNNFVLGKIGYSYEKIERLLTKCGIGK